MFQPPKKKGVCDLDGTPLIRRADDTVEIVRERLNSYEQLTAPVIAHYAGADYHPIPANRPPSEIFRDIELILKTAGKQDKLLPGEKDRPIGAISKIFSLHLNEKRFCSFLVISTYSTFRPLTASPLCLTLEIETDVWIRRP